MGPHYTRINCQTARTNNYKGNYYLTLSDLYLWKDEYPKAMEYAELAKELFMRGRKVNLYIERTQKRLKLLKEKQLEDEEFKSLFKENWWKLAFNIDAVQTPVKKHCKRSCKIYAAIVMVIENFNGYDNCDT